MCVVHDGDTVLVSNIMCGIGLARGGRITSFTVYFSHVTLLHPKSMNKEKPSVNDLEFSLFLVI